ncbi:MAG TPA: AsmA-like C-terminal region-containing protein [Candidatus Acidoferrales bacterium]|nr:AsmA-like C-terminal region-containing protein [Candidatus Acidoferrales bacterium]
MNTQIESLRAAAGDAVTESQGRTLARAVWFRSGWATSAIFLLCGLWLAGLGLSFAIRHSRLQGRITAHLEAAFGRKVEVGSYGLSLWTGPVLDARSVRVSEDPQFGQEYFLRADSIAIRLRWGALLRGHVELGTLSLSHPSLNIVRNAAGDWNLEEWLPSGTSSGTGALASRTARLGSFQGPPAEQRSRPALRFHRIDISDGRINFKNAEEKLPFAFADVSGSVETDSPGRWRLTLDATPMRAALGLQRAGTIHVSGYLGGTSSRLRPGDLSLSWDDASLTDFLRLATGDDHGVRGAMALSLRAQTDGDGWALQGRAELRELHRWDLALRSDDPAVNVAAKMKWHPATSDMDSLDASVELPHSAARLTGVVDWGPPFRKSSDAAGGTRLQVSSAGVDLRDLVSWIRAFHPGLPEDLGVRGVARARLSLSDWPPRIDMAAVSLSGATLTGKRLTAPIRVGDTTLRYSPSGFTFTPAVVSFGAGAGSLRIESAASSSSGAGKLRMMHPPTTADSAPLLDEILRNAPGVRIKGSVSQMRELVATANALGWNLSRGWDVAGPMRCDLHWAQGVAPWRAIPTGTIQIGGASGPGEASLWAPFLNLPIERIRAAVSLEPGDQQISLAGASAFGAHWTGSFARFSPDAEWQFALSADRLSGKELDRWLDPRWRESFLDRVLPFLKATPRVLAVPESLRARGTLAVAAFELAPLQLRHLAGSMEIAGRRVQLKRAEAQFYGGRLGANFEADLRANPGYGGTFDFSGVNVAALAADVPGLEGSLAGLASGRVTFSASGPDRGALASSLACQGRLRVENPEWSEIKVPPGITLAHGLAGKDAFDQAEGSFMCGPGEIQLQDVRLSGERMQASGTGTIGFRRNLDLRIRVRSASRGDQGAGAGSDAPDDFYRLTGSAAAPRITRVAALPESADGQR